MSLIKPDDMTDDQLRRVRIAADIEISRRYPGWYCLMFHHGYRLEKLGLFRLTYSLQAHDCAEPEIIRVTIGKIMMADGSTTWGAAPNVGWS